MKQLQIILSTFSILLFFVGCDYPSELLSDDVWYFNFAPVDAPGLKPFVKVSGDVIYTKSKGYGWIGVEGSLRKGRWGDGEPTFWETWDNLNLICRPGPDDLARSFFAGPAVFAVDLEPGRYEVWLLTGDFGYKEYIPHEPYEIMLEGVVAFKHQVVADDFYRQFETPPLKDDLTQDGVWQMYVEPRFKWIRTLIDVADGQLNINIAGERRDQTILDFMGDYAITEIRGGPAKRFAGALNAMVIIRLDNHLSGHELIKKIDSLRLDDFSKNWPLKEPENRNHTQFSIGDRQRGYTVFFPGNGGAVLPTDQAPHDEKPIKLRSTPGENVPITFGVCPLRDLGETRIALGEVQRLPDGAKIFPEASGHVAYGVVRYAARPAGRERKSWRPSPAMIVPTDTWNILGGVAKQFWLTCTIPEGTIPGLYKGNLRISPANAEAVTIEIEIEILPFRLRRPTHLAVGMTYFSPVQYAYFGEDHFWKRMEAEFRDMRAHGMTCVQYTGIRMDDYRRMDRALNLYRRLGFENPVNLLESYGAMTRLRRNGIAWDTEQFHRRYVQFIREFLEEAKQRNWPPIIINFGDEFTNEGIEEFGARVAKELKTIPGIVTGADANGYKEVALLAPEVDIVSFNNGWEGPKKVNRDIKLLKKETVHLIRKDGAIPWLVNVGVDRFSNGFWLWRMARIGVRGKMEWIYRGYNGMPYNSFDASPMVAHIVYPGPDGTSIPSLDYERMRLGLDDLAYLYTLETILDATRGHPEKQAAVMTADAFLEQLSGMIEDDMNKYTDLQGNNNAVWTAESCNAMRAKVADLILSLR